jgi:pimeloyl-ACP methyl ester carboxylesterase
MKIDRTLLKLTVATVIFVTLFNSCKKDTQSTGYAYYVSKRIVSQYNETLINGLVDLASISYPEVSGIKKYVASGVNVYKIVYKTEVAGSQINASGLICIPDTPGSYPVLSFQNGTNTLYSDAPSEAPQDNLYQLVELTASMGYIVVIADYPGFGESTQVQHPYLITEPTVRSLVDLLYATKEMVAPEFPGYTVKNQFYLLGYSQGGWATLALHKALEQNYSNDFNLKGSSCGAGPYNIVRLLEGMVNKTTYPMPVYLAYIVNAYISYDQFTNPVTDIFREPYASRVNTLFNGTLTSAQINDQLTTTISDLINPDFLSGFETAPKYASVLNALNNNSITAWHTNVPLLMTHGGSDTQVDPVSTETMYSNMIAAGTSLDVISKIIVPGVDHSPGAVPCMLQGILFLNNLKNTK